MRMFPKITLGGVLAFALTGCGSLQVQVSVLNPTVVEAEADRQFVVRSLPRVAGQTTADVNAQVLKYEQEHFNYVSALAEQYRAEAEEMTDPDAKELLSSLGESLEGDFSRTMGPYYQDVRARLVAVTEAIQVLRGQEGPECPKSTRAIEGKEDEEARKVTACKEGRLAYYLRVRDEILRNLDARVREEIAMAQEGLPALSKEGRRTMKAARLSFDAQRRTFLPGASIHNDPYAFAVANADDELWEDKFNRVYGRGFMGNLNMAVKLDQTGSYTIKGLTFDPSDVARVASKVTTQALLIASQIAGVPIQTQPQAGTPGAALATSSKALADAEKIRAQQNLLLLSHKDALRSLAGTILREWPSLDNDDDAKRKAAIAAIRAGFTANKSRLNLTPPAAPSTSSDEDDDAADQEDDTDL